MRRRLFPLFVALVAALAPPVAAAPPTATVPVVVIEGRGWGHGVGMAQDGAFWMGKAGSTTPQILAAFYPGTTIGKSRGPVRVLVLASPRRQTSLLFPNGGRVESDGGLSLPVPAGGQARVGHDGTSYWAERVDPSTSPTSERATTTTGHRIGEDDGGGTTTSSSSTTAPLLGEPSPTTTAAGPLDSTTTSTTSSSTSTTVARSSNTRRTSTAPLRVRPDGGGTVGLVERSRRYRGVVDVRLDGAGLLRLVNEVDVEQYLKGMGEVRDSRWPAAALRTQAIAARTYAMRAMAAGGELCDDTRCQVYLGAQAEYGAMNKAVADSAGQVVHHKGRLASTVYSANAGGHSATREEGFGTGGDGYPYLRAATYVTKDQMPWTVKVALTDVAARLGYPGRLAAVTVARSGPSGRAVEVALAGDRGTSIVAGRTFDARLGLKSTLFTLRIDQAIAPPAPPPALPGAIETIQALPEEAVALPPRPEDPPLPESLLARAAPPERERRAGVVPTTTPPFRNRSTNTALALFLILAVAAVPGAAAIGRGPFRRRPFSG